MEEEGLKITLMQRNPHKDYSVVSPTLDKDAILVDDEKEAVD